MARIESEKFGETLKELRGDRPQSEIAAAVGITTAALEAYESGCRVPRDEIKIRLANLFGVRLDSLFGESVRRLRLTGAGWEETPGTFVEAPCVTLAACRVNAGMDPETWAAALGVTVKTVKRWEAGEATPKTSTVFRIAQLSRIPLGIIKAGDQEARA